jgi:hypothetical protein
MLLLLVLQTHAKSEFYSRRHSEDNFIIILPEIMLSVAKPPKDFPMLGENSRVSNGNTFNNIYIYCAIIGYKIVDQSG